MTNPRDPRTRDVEKRWHDRAGFRHAALFVAGVVSVALVVMVVVGAWAGGDDCGRSGCASPERYLVAVVPAGILVLGTLVAFGQTYRMWRRGGTWPIWQGAGWFLMAATLVYLAISSGFVVNG